MAIRGTEHLQHQDGTQHRGGHRPPVAAEPFPEKCGTKRASPQLYCARWPQLEGTGALGKGQPCQPPGWGHQGKRGALPVPVPSAETSSGQPGQPHHVVGPVEDHVVLADEDIPEDPELARLGGDVHALKAEGAVPVALQRGHGGWWLPSIPKLDTPPRPVSLQSPPQWDAHLHHVGAGRHGEGFAVDVEDDAGQSAGSIAADLGGDPAAGGGQQPPQEGPRTPGSDGEQPRGPAGHPCRSSGVSPRRWSWHRGCSG